MSVFSDFPAFRAVHEGCVATIGKYDGMHIGHQHVLDTLLETAKARNKASVVILSEPHPEEFFAGDEAAPRLTQFQDKIDFLLKYGVDAVFRMNFDQALCDLDAEDFIRQYLSEGLSVDTLIVGDDFRFGKNRRGDFQMLAQKGHELGYEVIRETPLIQAGERVSSTLVRSYLEQGDCHKVKTLLGRFFSIGGIVEQGKKLGRELGVPTANIAMLDKKIPLQGVFCVLVNCKGQLLEGVASVGFNPTVENSNVPKLEVFIFDFDEDIYGEYLRVSFVSKLRDEIAFPDLDALKVQMKKDIEQARQTLVSLQADQIMSLPS